MNNLNSTDEEIDQKYLFKSILLRCPKCDTQKAIKIPSKIINQSKTGSLFLSMKKQSRAFFIISIFRVLSDYYLFYT
jgi:hypothetical protein